MLLSFTKPVITFQTAQAGKISATATYSVLCGDKEYTMEVSRYADLRNVSIKCFSAGRDHHPHKEDEQHPPVKKSGKGYYATWGYRSRGDRSTRIYLPDAFESVYPWGF